MRYLKEEDTLSIPEDFEQAFFKDPFVTTDLTASVMLKAKGIIDKTDINILRYIFETKFCTGKQMAAWAAYEGMEEDELCDRLEILFANTLINKFGFVDEDNYRGPLPADIKVFYCLHDGGKHILDNYSGEEFIDWQAGYNTTHAKNVLKSLISAELYTQLYTSPSSRLIFHVRRPLFFIKMDRFWGGDTYCISKNDETHYYICDTFLSSDRTNMVRNKLRNYESVFSTNIWKSTYRDCGTQPHLIFITDNDEAAGILAGEVAQTKLTGYLITTKERLLTGITTPGSFLTLNKERNTLDLTALSV